MAAKNKVYVKSPETRAKMSASAKKRNARPAMDEEAANMLAHEIEIAALPPVNHTDSEQMKTRIKEYFEICFKNKVHPSIAGLATAFHVHRYTIWQWAHRTPPSDPRSIVRAADQVINTFVNDLMVTGKIDKVVGMFLLQNNADYTNGPDKHENLAPLQIDAPKTNEELAAKYLSSVAEDNNAEDGGDPVNGG